MIYFYARNVSRKTWIMILEKFFFLCVCSILLCMIISFFQATLSRLPDPLLWPSMNYGLKTVPSLFQDLQRTASLCRLACHYLRARFSQMPHSVVPIMPHSRKIHSCNQSLVDTQLFPLRFTLVDFIHHSIFIYKTWWYVSNLSEAI